MNDMYGIDLCRAFSAQSIQFAEYLGRWPRLLHPAPLALMIIIILFWVLSSEFQQLGEPTLLPRRNPVWAPIAIFAKKKPREFPRGFPFTTC
jgi:hypothetical protein